MANPSSRPTPEPAAVPRGKDGRMLWPKVPGFVEWFKKNAADKTNDELAEHVLVRWGTRPSVNSLVSMRRSYGVRLTSEAKRRALDTRDSNKAAAKPEEAPVDPHDKMEMDTLRAQLRHVTARQTFWEIVGDKIILAQREINRLPPVRAPRISLKKGLTEEQAVLLISDVQAGLVTSAKESGGLGEFNTHILLEEIAYLRDSIDAVMRYHTNVRTLHVWFLGDILEGQTIFEGQPRQVDMNVVEQIMFVVEHFARLLHHLAGRFDHLYATGVVGNHGRVGRKGELSPMSNLDYLIYRWLQERTKPIEHLKWDIPETWWTVRNVLDWRFLLVHGDDTGHSAFGGIPFYGMTRTKNRYREMLSTSGRLNTELPTDIDFCCLGHHSQAGQFQNIIAAGSWPGGTEFSLKRLQMSDIPSAPLFAVARAHGVTWRRDIQLRPIRRTG